MICQQTVVLLTQASKMPSRLLPSWHASRLGLALNFHRVLGCVSWVRLSIA
jgi:hypothetical protein